MEACKYASCNLSITLNQLNRTSHDGWVEFNVSLCGGNALVPSQCHQHTHPNSFVCQFGDEPTSPTVRTGTSQLGIFVDLVHELTQRVCGESAFGIFLGWE